MLLIANLVLAIAMFLSSIIEYARCKLYLEIYNTPKKRIIWRLKLINILNIFVKYEAAEVIVDEAIRDLNRIFSINMPIFISLPRPNLQTISYIFALIYIFPDLRLLLYIIILIISNGFK